MNELTIDLKNYPQDAPVFYRTAVRAIIRRGDRYLMIYSRKYGDCKFPGGGQEQGETNMDTLLREVREESGRDVKPETAQMYLLVHERRMGMLGDVLDMNSFYYICEVSDEIHEQNLQDYEVDEEYEVLWMTLTEALRYNKHADLHEKTPWVARETAVMERLNGPCPFPHAAKSGKATEC